MTHLKVYNQLWSFRFPPWSQDWWGYIKNDVCKNVFFKFIITCIFRYIGSVGLSLNALYTSMRYLKYLHKNVCIWKMEWIFLILLFWLQKFAKQINLFPLLMTTYIFNITYAIYFFICSLLINSLIYSFLILNTTLIIKPLVNFILILFTLV